MSKLTKSTPRERRSRSIAPSQQTKLWWLAAGRCAFADCRKILVLPSSEIDPQANIGKMAHIIAFSEEGPRPRPVNFPEEKINKYENLILLCANHHDEVDAQPNKYTVELVRRIKDTHESWINERLATEEFNSADLESIITWLAVESTIVASTNFHPIAPNDKIRLNEFSPPIQRHVNTGLAREPEVKTYVKDRARLDMNYPERLLQPLLDDIST